MKVKLDKGAFMPTRAHAEDAGLDLKTPFKVSVAQNGGSVVIDTGVHMEIPDGYFGKIEGKSGLNVNHGIVACGGVIDCGYTGSIVVKLYNFGKIPYVFKKGDKIAQIILIPCIAPELEQVEELTTQSERGDNGFGSTGR